MRIACGTLLAALAAGIAGIAGCASSTPSASAGAFMPARLTTASKGPHLYVADGETIYRFALVNGLPQKSPEVFATGPAVEFLGVDGSGAIYAAGNNSDGVGFVEKYGSDGTLTGTATLNVRIGAFAVDRAGYMYASLGAQYGAEYAYTYSPDAFQESSATPIATLYGDEPYAFFRMAVGDRGRLYASGAQRVNIFDHPHESAYGGPTHTFAAPGGKWLPVFEAAIAFDQHDRFYGSLGYRSFCNCGAYRFLVTDFDAVADPLNSSRVDHIVYGRGCRYYVDDTSIPYWAPGYVSGMAVYGGYIDAACSGDTNGVYVFHADRFKHEDPVESLSGLTNPTDAKIGP